MSRFSATVRLSSRWYCWKTKPTYRLFSSILSLGFKRSTWWSSSRYSPLHAWSSIPRIERSVDLPAPDGPMIVTNSPASIFRLIRRRTNVWPARVSKDFSMLRISIMGSPLSFVPDGGHRIEARGAPRGEAGRGEAGQGEDGHGRAEGGGIGRRYAEQEASEGAGRDGREGKAEGDPREHGGGGLRQDHPEEPRRLGAEREADADLAQSPGDRSGDDSVDADGREDERQRGEEAQQRRAEALRHELAAHGLLQRARTEGGKARVERRDRRPEGRGRRARIARKPNEKRHRGEQAVSSDLLDRDRDLRHVRVAQRLEQAVAAEADDGPLGAVDPEALSDGIAAGPEPAGRRLVDDRDGSAVGQVGLLEFPAGQDLQADRAEVRGADGGRRDGLSLARRLARELDRLDLPVASEGEHAGPRGRSRAGQRGGGPGRGRGERPRPRRVVAGDAELDRRQRDAARLEPRVRGEGVPEASREQAPAREQDEAERDLRGDEGARKQRAPPASGAVVLQRRQQREPRRLERGQEPEEHAGRHRDGQGKRQDAEVERRAEGAER